MRKPTYTVLDGDQCVHSTAPLLFASDSNGMFKIL